MTNPNNTVSNIYQNNMFSKFSNDELEFIKKYQNRESANTAPDSANILGKRGNANTPNEQFKLVSPTVSNGRITGFVPTGNPDAPIGGVNEGYTSKIIQMANDGKITPKEAIFIIRARHQMIDAPYSPDGAVRAYGAGNPSVTEGGTMFTNAKMRNIIYNQDKARQIVQRINEFEDRQKDLEKQGKLRETFDETGTGRKIYYDDNETNPNLRWKLLVPDFSDILPANNPDSERAILDESSVLNSGKNTRDPNDETLSSSGPKLNFLQYIKTTTNPDGSLSLDEKATREANLSKNPDAMLSFDTYVYVNDQIGAKLYKWFLAPDTGLPKDATIIGAAIAGSIKDHASRSYLFLEKYLPVVDRSLVRYKSFKSFMTLLQEINSGEKDVNDPKIIVDILNGPVKPWALFALGRALKPKLRDYLLKKLAIRIATGSRLAGGAAYGLAAAGVTAALVTIDILTISWDVYTENPSENESLEREALNSNYLPGPYIQTKGSVKIPMRNRDETYPDFTPNHDYDVLDNCAVPIGVEKDKQGNPIPLKRKDIFPNAPDGDQNVPLTDPKTGEPIPGTTRIKPIYPQKMNLKSKAYFSPPNDSNMVLPDIVGFDPITDDISIPTWNDVAEDVTQDYIGTYYNKDRSDNRTKMFAEKILENDNNGVPQIKSTSELWIPPENAQFQFSEDRHNAASLIDTATRLENLGVLDFDRAMQYLTLIYLNITGPSTFFDGSNQSQYGPTQQNKSVGVPNLAPELYGPPDASPSIFIPIA